MPRLPSLETLAIAHAAALLVFVTWAFGGNAPWVRMPLSVFGSLGLLITVAALRQRAVPAPAVSPNPSRLSPRLRMLHWLWPLLAYNLLAIASTLQPALYSGIIENAHVFVRRTDLAQWPATVDATETLRDLWLFDALFLPCFNLVLAVRSRTVLRTLLLVGGINAFVLSVFGSLQKLTGAPGLFFGAFPSPNKRFFASFIYHNHWGAFIVLTAAACLGLIFHRLRRPSERGFLHSPAFSGTVALVFLAATIPLSGSRSCTALILLLAAIATVRALRLLWRTTSTQSPGSRVSRFSRLAPAFLLLAALLSAGAFIYDLARPNIADRSIDTVNQFAAMRAQGGIGGRASLYSDTWRMVLDRPWFGWGLGSYGSVFWLYNSQQSAEGLPMYFHDAHSDWLQSLAETGFTGTLCLALLVVLPLLAIRRHRPFPSLPSFLLLGCGLILLYAWIEFPFGSAAVLFVFWLTFFAAIRLVQLEDRPAELRSPTSDI